MHHEKLGREEGMRMEKVRQTKKDWKAGVWEADGGTGVVCRSVKRMTRDLQSTFRRHSAQNTLKLRIHSRNALLHSWRKESLPPPSAWLPPWSPPTAGAQDSRYFPPLCSDSVVGMLASSLSHFFSCCQALASLKFIKSFIKSEIE